MSYLANTIIKKRSVLSLGVASSNKF